jgi:hypothetical protein
LVRARADRTQGTDLRTAEAAERPARSTSGRGAEAGPGDRPEAADRRDRAAGTVRAADTEVVPPQPSGAARFGQRREHGGEKAARSGGPAATPGENRPEQSRSRRKRALIICGAAAGVVLLASLPLLAKGRGSQKTDAVVLPTATDFLPTLPTPDPSHAGGSRTQPSRSASASPGTTSPEAPSTSPSAGGASPTAASGHPAGSAPPIGTSPTRPGDPTPAETAAQHSAPPQATKPLYVQSTQVINPGDRIVNGSTVLTMTTSDKLEVVVGGAVRWTSGATGAEAVFQADGNFVMYDDVNYDNAVWSSGTTDHPHAVLVVEADGNVDIQDNGTVIWATDTAS